MSKEVIETVRERIDIVDLISEHVVLRKTGVNYVGICPFHAEKTPSFHVSSIKQFYHCFGCNKSGDVFQFLMDLEGADFKEVLVELAKRANVDLPLAHDSVANTSPQKQISPNTTLDKKKLSGEKKILFRMQELACRFYSDRLSKSQEAQNYLEQRGISPEMIKVFGLGYSPVEFDSLKKLFLSRKCSIDWMVRSGLFSRKSTDEITESKIYDRFRSRIMFPIRDVQGRTVGFSGRIFQPSLVESAKYINSPDSFLFKKGELLYGLDLAKDAIRKEGVAFLVEGNLDVISLHQHGYPYTVAPLGTALTDVQIKLLKRFLPPHGKVFLILDGDLAGKKAALRDIELFFQDSAMEAALRAEATFELDVRVVTLPSGQDPDSLIRLDKTTFDSCISKARPAIDYVFDELTSLFDMTSLPMQSRLLTQLAPLVLHIKNPISKELYIAKLASRLAMTKDQVTKLFHALPQKVAGKKETFSIDSSRKETTTKQNVLPELVDLLAICIEHPQLLQKMNDATLSMIEESDVKTWLTGIISKMEQKKSTQELLSLLPAHYKAAVGSLIFSGVFSKLLDPNLAWVSICKTIEEKFRKKELGVLRQKLSIAQQAKKTDEIRVVIDKMRELFIKNT